MRVSVLPVLVGLIVVALPACTDPPRTRPGGGTTDGGRPGGGGETGAQCGDGIDNDMDGLTDCDEASCAGMGPCAGFDAGPQPDRGVMACEAIEYEAETGLAPVDIIWVIDNSGSMDGEARIVQDNMNTFAAAIAATSIDYHVVVMTRAGFVNVPAPLGTDTMRFRALNVDVQSNDGLADAVENFAMYSDFLRPTALTHFIFVTDDESDRMTASAFQMQMTMLLGHAFVAHSIVSPPGSRHCPSPFGCGGIIPEADGCTGPNGDAAENGDQYWALSGTTGGQRFSICTSDWSALFRTLAASIAVPMPLPCEFDIPAPPMGMMFDRMRVNVVFTPTGGAPTTFRFVGTPTGADCPAGADGWYYDDPVAPTRIILCPSTCSRVTADETGRVDIALGCETLII